jgi:hypothetical protein
MFLQMLNSERSQLLDDIFILSIIVMLFLIFMNLILRNNKKHKKERKRFYRLKEKHFQLRLYISEQIGCEHRPDYLDRLPYNSTLAMNVRSLKLENNFEIITE